MSVRLMTHTRPHGYIGGRWVEADGGALEAVVNPADGKLITTVPVMGAAETRRAIEASVLALESPTPIDERKRRLLAIADGLLDEKDELARLVTLENGKPLSEAAAEVEYSAGFFRYCGENVDAVQSYSVPGNPKGHAWTVHHRPAGVVGLITPWNFPLAMLAKKLSAALAADCAAVCKPSSKTPLSVIALFAILERAGLDRGRANLVIGNAREISDELCRHPDVRIVSFTGSTEVGRKLAAAAAPGLKRLSLELGGNAPFIVFAGADLVLAADQLLANKFRGAGQTCVCTNRVYVEASVAEEFTALVQERVARLRVGDGMVEGTTIGPLIDRRGFDKVARHVADALEKGAQLIVGGTPEASNQPGAFFPPTVLRGATQDMECVTEETFGPLVPIVEFTSEAEVVRLANSTEYGLAAYVFTADDARADRVIASLRFGHVGLNTGTGPTPEAPFGGVKQSGYGREGGREGILEFTETQVVPRRG